MSFIKLADKDGSGRVSREEFLDALHRHAHPTHPNFTTAFKY